MLDLLPDHLRLFIAIGGLLFVLLLVGSLAQKYEQYMAAKRLAVQRLMIGIQQIEEALDKSRGGGLPSGMGKLLRNELLARYITIRQIFPRQPGISQQVMQAEERARIEPEGATSVNSAAITSVDSFNRYVIGLNEIYGLLNGQTLGRVSAAERSALQQKILDFQLSAASRYFTGMALEYARKGEWPNATRAARALDSFLVTRPRGTPLATQLRNESKELLLAIDEQRLPGGRPAGSAERQDA
jgi:hypothetical protein